VAGKCLRCSDRTKGGQRDKRSSSREQSEEGEPNILAQTSRRPTMSQLKDSIVSPNQRPDRNKRERKDDWFT